MNEFKITFQIVLLIILLIQIVRLISCEIYIKELKEQGYSKEWANHKALVEYGFRPIDDEYKAIQED